MIFDITPAIWTASNHRPTKPYTDLVKDWLIENVGPYTSFTDGASFVDDHICTGLGWRFITRGEIDDVDGENIRVRWLVDIEDEQQASLFALRWL